jgi:hypothetical protein
MRLCGVEIQFGFPVSRNVRTSLIVASEFSSMIQCPLSGTPPPCTFVAANFMISAIWRRIVNGNRRCHARRGLSRRCLAPRLWPVATAGGQRAVIEVGFDPGERPSGHGIWVDIVGNFLALALDERFVPHTLSDLHHCRGRDQMCSQHHLRVGLGAYWPSYGAICAPKELRATC